MFILIFVILLFIFTHFSLFSFCFIRFLNNYLIFLFLNVFKFHLIETHTTPFHQKKFLIASI